MMPSVLSLADQIPTPKKATVEEKLLVTYPLAHVFDFMITYDQSNQAHCGKYKSW